MTRRRSALDALVTESPLARRLERVTEALNAGQKTTAVALILTTNILPPDAHQLDPEHAVVLIGPDAALNASVLAQLRQDRAGTILAESILLLDLRSGATEAALSFVGGVVRETAILGARGDGKSVTGAAACLYFGYRHRLHGGTTPVKILTVTGTFTEHRARLCETLREPFWRGLWQESNDSHTWTATIGGVTYATLELIGIEDQGGLDRARIPAHAAWFEEPAPAGAELGSSGLSEDALQIASTSLRLPSYTHPILLTSNYGSESHWTWQRYAVRRHPGTHLIRIQPGERATAEQRAAAREALEGRPDLIRRLLDGEPALIVAGQPVLEGIFNPAIHVAPQPLTYTPGQALILGHDGGLTPTTVICQWNGPQLQVLAALTSPRAGTVQHLRDLVIPWLLKHAPQAELEHWIDPSMVTPSQSNLDESPEKVLRRQLGGRIHEGEVKWQPRLDPLLAILGQLVSGGRPALVICPTATLLIEACVGRWHYPRDRHGAVSRDMPEKDHPWSDLGDALLYCVGGAKPWRQGRKELPRTHQAKMSAPPRYPIRRPFRGGISGIGVNTPWNPNP